MYAIEQHYISYTHPEKSFTRLLNRRYQTAQRAERAAKQWRWVCRPDGGQTTEESDAVVVTVADNAGVQS
ncbi:hypothetical protein [Methylobacter marinus]|uniref:hypothetical protein n=1 Tax=Methylobacter marinus TaxID=34058 RepID=UPI00037445E2|nr:hypothetical protein [Methylobacter marinus]